MSLKDAIYGPLTVSNSNDQLNDLTRVQRKFLQVICLIIGVL